MSPPEKEVARMFSRKLRVWEDALQRWRKKCKGVQEEFQKLERSRQLVSQSEPFERSRSGSSPLAPRARSNATYSDALPLAGPSSLSIQNEQRLVNIEGQAKRCDQVIKRIEDMISRLNNARTTGVWKYDRDSEIKIKKQKKFITGVVETVQRGEDLEVLKLEGEWWHVRNSTGVEGWIHNGEVSPILPPELTSQPSGDKPLTKEEWIQREDDANSVMAPRG